MTRGFRPQRGFTLVELIVVLALISLVTLLSGIFYNRFLTQNAILNTTDQLVSQLRQSQVYAVSGKQNSNWGVSYDSHVLTLYSGSSYTSRNTAFDQQFTVNNNITFSGLTDLNFTKVTGLPNAPATITITGNNSTKVITVNQEGGVSR